MPKADTTAYLELPSRVMVTLTPEWIRMAIMTADSGSLRMGADLCTEMMVDDRIGGALSQRVRGMLGLPFSFVPDGDRRQKSAIVKAAESDWWEANAEADLVQLRSWAILFGVGLGELRWEQKDGRMVPKLHVWNPRHLRWDWTTRRWLLWVDNGQEIEIVPGDGKWILDLPYGTSSPWQRAPWRGLAIWWLLKEFARQDWGRYSERHGNPIITAESVKDSSGTTANRKELAQILYDIGASATAVMPEGHTLKLVEATANTWETFQAQVAAANSAAAIAILGGNLTTEVTGGSLAATEAHMDIRADLVEADAEHTTTTLYQQQWSWWTAFNYGDSTKTPWPQWNTTPPDDLKTLAEQLKTLGEALPALKELGVDIAPILDRFGLAMTAEPSATPLKLSQNGPRTPVDFVVGQLYSDAVADHLGQSGALQPTVLALAQLLTTVTGYDDLRAKLLGFYGDLSPDALAETMERALILSELAGHYAVHAEMGGSSP